MTTAQKERARIVEYLRAMSQSWWNVGERDKSRLVFEISNDIERGFHRTKKSANTPGVPVEREFTQEELKALQDSPFKAPEGTKS